MRELIEARGCELIYLPPYSPDLNPIEESLSKEGKHIQSKIGARTKEALIESMGEALAAVSAEDVRGFRSLWLPHPGAATMKDAVCQAPSARCHWAWYASGFSCTRSLPLSRALRSTA